jgi:hypothetical protein
LITGGGVASAEDQYGFWPESQYGIELSVGGGVETFADQGMRNVTDTGGMWDVRGVLGTRSPVSLEAAYTGSARMIDSIFGDQGDAALVGTGLEGAMRLQLLPMEVFTPYAFGGLGWKRYDIAGADFSTADTGIADEDTLLEIPVGAGLSYRARGTVLDARFTYRAAVGEDLVVQEDIDNPIPDTESDSGRLAMDTWAISARLGYEF